MRTRFLALCLAGALMLTGCAPFIGSPSATLMTRDPSINAQYEAVSGRVKESECFYWALVLFVMGNAAPSHEGRIDRILEKYDADVLLDAELETSTFGFPYIYLQSCATVKGIPAKRKSNGAMLPGQNHTNGKG